MSAWGASAKSCKSLLDRVEQNDAALSELFILPTKNFGGPELDRLADIFGQGKNDKLKVLSASGHKVPKESLVRLGKAIANAATDGNASICSIAIGDHSMGDDAVISFCNGIQEGGGKSLLESIDFSWKGISRRGLHAIFQSFNAKNSPRLRVLNLSRNEKIGQGGSGGNPHSITTMCQLEELDISHCRLSGEFVSSFCNTNMIPMNLKKFHIQGNPLEVLGFNSVVALLRNSMIEELNTSNCGIGDDALEGVAFVEGAWSNNLRFWNLSDNNITSNGMKRLAVELENGYSLSRLEELNLAGNSLGDESVKILAEAIKARHGMNNISRLTSLDLSNTNCGVSGATSIIRLAKLKSLHLFNNNLGSDGFRSILETLKGGHSTLEHLDLGGNNADQASVVVLLNALLDGGDENFSNNLKVLVVGGNESGEAVEQMVAKVRRVHPGLDIARDKKAK